MPESETPKVTLTQNALSSYLDKVRAENNPAVFIVRQFMAREEWDRSNGFDSLRLQGTFREHSPDLALILQHSRVMLIGEPGLGKTWLARRSAVELANKGVTPVFVPLSGYQGSLVALVRNCAPTVAGGTMLNGESLRWGYVLDGLDEIPAEYTERFAEDLKDLVFAESDARFVLTCRQAVYEGLRQQIPSGFREFFPLGFSQDDIRAYVVAHAIDPDAFDAELERTDLWIEASIPFVLSELVKIFRTHRRLENTRSDNLAVVTDELLAKRTRFGVSRQRSALQLLGLGMELYSRNELNIGEATGLLAAGLATSHDEASALLGELTQTILLHSGTAMRFQVRSFGEYFAARRLESAPLARVLDYCRFRGTLVLNPTWANTVSYLIEISPAVRSYFVKEEPEWVLPSSPACLTTAQRLQTVKGVIERMASAGQDLLGSASVSYLRLGRLLTTGEIDWLRQEFNGPKVARRANALLLLGVLKDEGAVKEALALAQDSTIPSALRRAAFAAVESGGTAGMVPLLLNCCDPADPWHSSAVAAAASLVTPENLGLLLATLARMDVIVAQLDERLAELPPAETLGAVIDFFLNDLGQACNQHLTRYLKGLWPQLRMHADHEILVKIGELLAATERAGIHSAELNIEVDLLDALRSIDPDGIVSRTALTAVLLEGLPFLYISFAVARLSTPEVARWLLKVGAPAKLLMQIASHADEDVRAVLRPAIAGQLGAQEDYQRQHRQQEEERARQELTQRVDWLSTVAESADPDKVFLAFYRLTASRWPELSPERQDWLAGVVSSALAKADPINSVEWLGELRRSLPPVLHLLTDLSGYYGLALRDDVLLVQALLGVTSKSIADYHGKRPLSAAALAEFERLLADPMLPVGAVDHFLGFIRQTGIYSASIESSLARLLRLPPTGASNPGSLIEMNRGFAAFVLSEHAETGVLVSIRKEFKGTDSEERFLDTLMARGDVSTVRERLSRVLGGSDARLRDAERPFPSETELNWIGKIRTEGAWDLLARLREKVLTLELPNLSMLMERTLAGIDKKSLIGVMAAQLAVTPEPWKEFTIHRMQDYKRELTFERAGATTLDEVLARLDESAGTYRVKLLCEGPSDAPVFQCLLNAVGLGAVGVHAVNGWNNVLSINFNIGPYLEGYQHALMVLDGDKGRDLAAPGRPLRKDAEKLIEKLGTVGVEVRVLERYGIENYFSQQALEKVLGRDLSPSFPLDDTRKVVQQVAGYEKERSGEVITHMQISDLDGTDLGNVITDLRRRVEYHR